jgi:hypothetical protein
MTESVSGVSIVRTTHRTLPGSTTRINAYTAPF